MSTKIYEAYRVAKGVDPYEVFWDIKHRGQREAKRRLGQIFHDILDGKSREAWAKVEEENALFKAWVQNNHPEAQGLELLHLYRDWVKNERPIELRRPEDLLAVSDKEILEASGRDVPEDEKPTAFDIDSWMHKQYGETLTKREWDLWAIDVAVTVRKYRNRYYLIPYCDRRCHLHGVLDFMQRDERLEDFAYWNNTDKPDEVKNSDWVWRRTVWNELTDHERWKECLVIDIVSWMGWPDVTPMIEVMRTRHKQGK